MNIYFISNNCKYEIEAVMKLFFPAQHFGFFYDTLPKDNADSAVIARYADTEDIRLEAAATIDGKSKAESERVSLAADDDECELRLARLLYKALSALTGKSHEWGMLTGVRPVKLVNMMIDKGLDRNGIFDKLKSEYLVSDKKCAIAYDTATRQAPFLNEIKQGDGKTFGLYISIPFCPTRCLYCSFVSQTATGKGVQGEKLVLTYIENLCEEIRYTGKLCESLGIRPDTVYFGGGTPTVLSAAQLSRLMKAVSESFDISHIREYTTEAGRPDTITREKLEAIKQNGCTRISINPQTLNDSVLEKIGRQHTTEQFYKAFLLARNCGFSSINTDIIAGLPTDTPEGFARTIDGLLALSPESITVHTLSVKRSSSLNSSEQKSGALHSPAHVMVDYATKRLYESGYKPYYLYRQKNMVDNLENIGWVKPSHESLYNIYIMEEVQTIIALGAAASTKLVDLKNGRLERIFNYKYPLEYNKNFELMLRRKDKIREFYAEKE